MKTREFTGVPIIRTVPGDVLRQELEARGLSQRAFAETMRRPEQLVSEIIRGKKRITAETALDFADALGIEAEFWLNLEVNFELDQARARRHVRLARAGHPARAVPRVRRKSA
jgi:addiction module HigA family antidote